VEWAIGFEEGRSRDVARIFGLGGGANFGCLSLSQKIKRKIKFRLQWALSTDEIEY